MMQQVDANAIDPLLTIAKGEADGSLRIAALNAATRFPLTEDAWRHCANVTRSIIVSELEGSPTRRSALSLAARIPLLSIRRHLRNMAAFPDVADGDIVAAALDDAGDPSRIRPLLERARTDRGESFEKLAAMPVEKEGVAPVEIAPLPKGPVPNARLWHALLLARLGEFTPLDAIFESGDPEPELFWGDPWSSYNAIASIRPVPQGMQEYLLGALTRFEESDHARMVKLIVWAATGIADAEGIPISEPEITDVVDVAPAVPPSSQKQVKQAITVSTHLPKRLFDQKISQGEIEILAHLPSNHFANLVKQIVIEGNKRAQALRLDGSEGLANTMLGNQIINIISIRPPATGWPVAELAMEHVKAERPALDDGQMAWLIARDQPDHLIKEITVALKPDLPSLERLRILNLLGIAADHKAGRGGSPVRGAGPGGEEPVGSVTLIDDMTRSATRARYERDRSTGEFSSREAERAAPASAGAFPGVGKEVEEAEFVDFAGRDRYAAKAGKQISRMEETEVKEERRVHAQILHEGRRRQTFVAEADNVIRCWIGLPEPERGAPADASIPQVEIPKEGLPLTAELCWRDQSDHKPLLLPPDRTARTGDCDLRIHVPAGELYVSAEIMFRYRGRVFEVVRVEAFALPDGEPERPDHKVKVRVEMTRREVIELPGSKEFDSTMIWEVDPSRAVQPGQQPPASLRVFGGHGGKHFDLKHTGAAIKWMNETLFVTEKSLVRRRAADAQPGGEELLAANDEEVRELLRDMARHGAALYNQLDVQGFEDPGERIQLLNRTDTHIPLEFVYDRGYPADDAKLCNGWLDALQSDKRTCPVCSQAPLARDQRDWVSAICPLGFWSLQKIIERLDFSAEEDSNAAYLPAPLSDQRNLPVLNTMVFASSHLVPEDERKNTWAALQQDFRSPTLANNWDEWKSAVEQNPPLLLILPHHGMKANLDYLQIGDESLPPQLGQLNRGQLTALHVNPNGIQPGPILLLLGCQTGTQTEVGYLDLARNFQQLKTSIVLGTLAQILGRHAAPLARELVSQLVTLDDPQADFGTIMRRVRRRMLARGYLMALCLVALGDAEWRLTPRPADLPH